MTTIDTKPAAPVLQTPNGGNKPVTPLPQPSFGIQLGGQNPLLAPAAPPKNVLPGQDTIKLFGGNPVGDAASPAAPAAGQPVPNASVLQLLQDTSLFKRAEAAAMETPDNPVDVPLQDGTIGTNDNFTEKLTEDEQTEQDIRAEKKRASEIADPQNKSVALQNIAEREEARKKWLERRRLAEQGAELFSVPKLKPEYLKNGWCQLFDGRTNFGWMVQNNGHYAGGQFSFGNGEIRSNPYHPGLLLSKAQFADFTLRFEYKTDTDAELLLLLKTPPDPSDLYSACYAIVLHSAQPSRPNGLLLGRQDRNAEKNQDTADAWHSVTVQIDQNQLQSWMDNQSPMTYIDTKPIRYGHVGFLAAKGQVTLRNIFWKPAAPLLLFDEKNSAGKKWEKLAGDVNFAETGENTGVYRLSGGPGVVETELTFGNFVLQMEYFNGITSSPSGLFFRAIKGKPQSGYQVSLQNFPTRQDRETSVGVDAGSFFGIKDARYVRASDGTWNSLTLLATNNHFQTWINGIPVCEIIDHRRRKADSVTGPFLDAGHLQFFAPKAGTAMQFRNVKIMQY